VLGPVSAALLKAFDQDSTGAAGCCTCGLYCASVLADGLADAAGLCVLATGSVLPTAAAALAFKHTEARWGAAAARQRCTQIKHT
jgi:hypothetical protein